MAANQSEDMSTAFAQDRRQRHETRSCAISLTCRACERSFPISETLFSCPDCGKNLDVDYDYELAKRRLAET